jgi:hypothetical protein
MKADWDTLAALVSTAGYCRGLEMIMEVRNLKSWTSFNKKIFELNKLRKRLYREKNGRVSELLFRGQLNASWKLDTTLDRYLNILKQISQIILRPIER